MINIVKVLIIPLFLLIFYSCKGGSRGSEVAADAVVFADSTCIYAEQLILCDSVLTHEMLAGVPEDMETRIAGATSDGTIIPRLSRSLDWLLFRGNQSLSGYTEIGLPQNPKLLWSFESEARASSSPVVSNGIAYWSDRRGHIRGVNLDGRLVFSYDFQTSINASPMIYGDVLYIGRMDGFMYALSLSRNEVLWNFETMGQVEASANHSYFSGRHAIIYGSYDNYLYCLDSKTGEEISRFESGYYINGAVALWNNHLIFGGCDSWLRIINSQTGIATDSLALENYIPASPAIIGNYCYVGDHSGNIYQVRLENGKFASHKVIFPAVSSDGSYTSVPAVTSESLYVVAADQHLYSINRTTGNINWRYLLKGTTGDSSPVVAKDKIIVCTRTGIVSIIDARTGALQWEHDTGEQITASPAVINGRFYILTGRGTLFCFGE